MNTVINRKCKNCGYFANGWCHWLGKQRNLNSYECEDGFKEKEKEYEFKRVK